MSHDRQCYRAGCTADTMSEKRDCWLHIGDLCAKAAFFKPLTTRQPRVYCDMDGVVADFDKMHNFCFGHSRERHTGWDHVKARKDFFRDMPPMDDMPDLWQAIAPLRPIFLTGCPTSVSSAGNEKIDWIRDNVGHGIPVICCRAKEKFLYCRPGDILIDDSEEYRPLWEAAGGVWVQHISAADTIKQLQCLGVI